MLKKSHPHDGVFMKKWYSYWVGYNIYLRENNKFMYVVVLLLEIFIIFLFIHCFIFQTSKAITDTMIPTLKINDRLLVNKLVYRFREPKRNEIVVFRSPMGDSIDCIRRVVGVPGDILKLNNGVFYVNDKALCVVGKCNNFSVKIPSGKYYMCGDNLYNIADSRVWGYINRDKVFGKVVFVFWPEIRFVK